MVRLQPLVAEERSVWYRGLFTQYSVASEGLAEACVPMFENCDPEVEDKFSQYFLYCIIASFGSQILIAIIWRLCTRKRRWKKYQDRVQKVAERLKNLQNKNEEVGGRQHFQL